jgi:hypothetical protein
MITRTAPNAVQSSDGFKVMIAKRFELHYEDGNGKVVVPIETMEDGELVVSASTISGDRRKLVSERISASLDFLGIQHRFD